MPLPTRFVPRVLLSCAIVVALLGAVVGYLWSVRSLASGSATIEVVIPRGAGPKAISGALASAGVHVSPAMLRWALRLGGDGGVASVRAGTYRLKTPLTLRGLVQELSRGEVILSELRFIEGWTFRQMRDAVFRHPDLLHDTADMTEAALLSALGATEPRAEGLFFPNTYAFAPGSSDLEVYRPAYREMKRHLEDAWTSRSSDLPLRSPYELLTLASIVEKETGRESDRPKVAAVFVNRLRKGMLLQSDPTTIYGLGERFDGNLRRRDLQAADNAWNTYAHAGLPPTPIASPGKASLAAVTRPSNTDALYFVARGDGSSEFSVDLAAHNRAVARYQLGRP